MASSGLSIHNPFRNALFRFSISKCRTASTDICWPPVAHLAHAKNTIYTRYCFARLSHASATSSYASQNRCVSPALRGAAATTTPLPFHPESLEGLQAKELADAITVATVSHHRDAKFWKSAISRAKTLLQQFSPSEITVLVQSMTTIKKYDDALFHSIADYTAGFHKRFTLEALADILECYQKLHLRSECTPILDAISRHIVSKLPVMDTTLTLRYISAYARLKVFDSEVLNRLSYLIEKEIIKFNETQIIECIKWMAELRYRRNSLLNSFTSSLTSDAIGPNLSIEDYSVILYGYAKLEYTSTALLQSAATKLRELSGFIGRNNSFKEKVSATAMGEVFLASYLKDKDVKIAMKSTPQDDICIEALTKLVTAFGKHGMYDANIAFSLIPFTMQHLQNSPPEYMILIADFLMRCDLHHKLLWESISRQLVISMKNLKSNGLNALSFIVWRHLNAVESAANALLKQESMALEKCLEADREHDADYVTSKYATQLSTVKVSLDDIETPVKLMIKPAATLCKYNYKRNGVLEKEARSKYIAGNVHLSRSNESREKNINFAAAQVTKHLMQAVCGTYLYNTSRGVCDEILRRVHLFNDEAKLNAITESLCGMLSARDRLLQLKLSMEQKKMPLKKENDSLLLLDVDPVQSNKEFELLNAIGSRLAFQKARSFSKSDVLQNNASIEGEHEEQVPLILQKEALIRILMLEKDLCETEEESKATISCKDEALKWNRSENYLWGTGNITPSHTGGRALHDYFMSRGFPFDTMYKMWIERFRLSSQLPSHLQATN